MKKKFLNILPYLLIVVSLAIAFLIIQHRDNRVMGVYHRYPSTTDTAHFSPEDRHTAAQFADSTVPFLSRMGLLVAWQDTAWETDISVNGALWRERSTFFKEQFLSQAGIYAYVNGCTFPVKVTDRESDTLLAAIDAPGRWKIYH